MQVSTLDRPDPACDEFVRGSPGGTLAHLPAFSRMVRLADGYAVHHLVAREGDAVRGVLPLTHVRSRLFGNRMVSHAYYTYGGILAADDLAREALYRHAIGLAMDRGCESIEFRNREPLPFDLELRPGKASMCLPLRADPEEMWKALDFKTRNHVRKAQKSGLTAEAGGIELLDDFYRVYTHRIHALGTPCYSRRVMAAMLTVFPEDSRLFIVRLGGQAIAVGLATVFNGLVENPHSAALTEYNKLCPNYLLYWEMIRHYCSLGARAFDFGRSTVDSGTYVFKKQWGSERVDLYYQFWARPGRTLSVSSPENPKYRQKIELWKRLPLWVTRLLGPALSRGLP